MDRDLRAEPLRTEGFRLALWSGHPLATRAVVEPEGVAGEVMLVRRNCEALRDTSRYFTDRGIRPRFSFRTFSEDRAAAMVRAGLGITVVPESWSEPGVTLVRLAEFTAVRHIGLVFGEAWSEGEASRPVLDAVRQVMTAR
jgi:DNA-binding transcriptional LysR family regulator